MERTYIGELGKHVDEEVLIKGWVDVRRDHGKLIFVDLRDMSGKVQMVVLPNHAEAHEAANRLRTEWVIEVTGKVNKRPERMVKEGLNGDIELEVLSIRVLAEAETLPFDISTDTSGIDENTRLRYRYVDLRSERMQRNLRLRSEFVRRVREFLFSKHFAEIETPLLTESSPRGSTQ